MIESFNKNHMKMTQKNIQMFLRPPPQKKTPTLLNIFVVIQTVLMHQLLKCDNQTVHQE